MRFLKPDARQMRYSGPMWATAQSVVVEGPIRLHRRRVSVRVDPILTWKIRLIFALVVIMSTMNVDTAYQAAHPQGKMKGNK